MKKVLVTGSTGFIGNLVIKLLLEKGYHVIATSSSIDRAKHFDWFEKVMYKELNFTKLDATINYFTFFDQPELLIHLAWEGLPNYKLSFHVDDNLPRHLLFLNNMLKNGLRDLTVAGTCLEYGMLEGCLSEEMLVDPIVSYAIAKNMLRIELEKVCKQQQISFKWLRLFYIYGKGQNANSLFAQLEKAIDNHESTFNMSGGEQQRDFLPIDKMVDIIVSIALQKDVLGVINCCSGQPIKVKRLVEKILSEKGAFLELNLGYHLYTDYEPMSFWGNISKLNKITKYE